MDLSPAQKATLKAYVEADSTLNALPHNSDGAFAIAEALKADASPDFIVWRTSVREQEFTDDTSSEGTTWSWPAFIARSVGEQAGWNAMFRNGSINAAKANVRQGFVDIFSGAQNSAPAQRAHCAAIAKRKANRLEKLFATGAGSTASPATMVVEGSVSYAELVSAMGW